MKIRFFLLGNDTIESDFGSLNADCRQFIVQYLNIKIDEKFFEIDRIKSNDCHQGLTDNQGSELGRIVHKNPIHIIISSDDRI